MKTITATTPEEVRCILETNNTHECRVWEHDTKTESVEYVIDGKPVQAERPVVRGVIYIGYDITLKVPAEVGQYCFIKATQESAFDRRGWRWDHEAELKAIHAVNCEFGVKTDSKRLAGLRLPKSDEIL